MVKDEGYPAFDHEALEEGGRSAHESAGTWKLFSQLITTSIAASSLWEWLIEIMKPEMRGALLTST